MGALVVVSDTFLVVVSESKSEAFAAPTVTTLRSLPVPYDVSSRTSCLTRMNASPSRAPPPVLTYMPARGPVRISAYCWPSTGLVVSFSLDADFRALEKEVVVPVDLSELVLAWAA